jgi:hypothetical protein
MPIDVKKMLDDLRNDIRNVGPQNIDTLRKNIPAQLVNMRSFVRPTREVAGSFAEADQRCSWLMRMIEDRRWFFSDDDPEVDELREAALCAVDQLEQKIDDAGASP